VTSKLCEFGLKITIDAIFAEFCGQESGERNCLQFYPSRNAVIPDSRVMNQKSVKIGLDVCSRDVSKMIKIKNYARVVFHLLAGKPPLRRSFWVLVCGVCTRPRSHCRCLSVPG